MTAKVTNKVQAAGVPADLRFGKVTVGQTQTNSVTMTNVGSLRSTANRTIYIASNESLIIPPANSGDDAAELMVTPATMNFGNVTLGSYAAQNGVLSATNSAVTISSVTSSDSEFSVSGLSLPTTIPAGQNASFIVTFAPQSSGPGTATIAFADAAGNPLAVEYVLPASTPPNSVDLSWNASTSPNVIGYNVYRANVSGGPYTRINPTLDPSLDYTDTSVLSGETYYYVATAVDSNNQESTYSNEVQAVIP